MCVRTLLINIQIVRRRDDYDDLMSGTLCGNNIMELYSYIVSNPFTEHNDGNCLF